MILLPLGWSTCRRNVLDRMTLVYAHEAGDEMSQGGINHSLRVINLEVAGQVRSVSASGQPDELQCRWIAAT